MDFIKFQADLLKKAVKDKVKTYHYSIEKEHINIITGEYVVRIPKKECFLDVEKLIKDPPINFNIMRFIDNAFAIKKTTTSIKVDKGELRVFENGDDKIYIDEKYLKIFEDKKATCVYMGTGPKNPIFIFDSNHIREEDCIGLILPVKYIGE